MSRSIVLDAATAPSAGPARKRVLLTTFGSLGDLHPYIALALGLRERGHEPIIGTSERYRERIETLGIGFRPIRPDLPDLAADPELTAKLMDRRTGTEQVVRGLVLPNLRESYDDTLAAAAGADLLVSHLLTFATPLVAERLGIPWTSTILQPGTFFSPYDKPVLAYVPFLARVPFLGPWFYRPLFRLLRWSIRSWAEPWHRLRAELGLPAVHDNPILPDGHSASLVLALFSPEFAARQPDWPPQTIQTGFPFHDEGDRGLPPPLDRFVADGPPPLVFTLGSAAVMDAGAFYEKSAAAPARLGRRAVLLVGSVPRNRPPALPSGVIAVDYVPYASLFPRAAAVIHQGGIGTTAQAMRAGRPMLVVPFAHDQPDNAHRLARLGIGRTIDRRDYTPDRAAAELRRLLDDPAYARRAGAIGRAIGAEDGVGTAAAALDNLARIR